MSYLLDTNIFIRSKNEMPVDVWPSFWSHLSELIREGKVYSSERVKEEIDRGNDGLKDWMNENATPEFYLSVDGAVLRKYTETQNWAIRNPLFRTTAKEEYAHVADAFLVATAAAKGMTLVTNEVSDPSCRKRVKIPDACDAIGVNYCDLNTALRDLGVKI